MKSQVWVMAGVAVLLSSSAHGQYWELSNGTRFDSITSINGVPRLAGSNSTGFVYLDGTDINNLVSIPGGNAPGEGYAGSTYISDDGQKISGGFDSNLFNDGSSRNVMAMYDIPSNTWTPFGAFGYYSASGTIREGSNSWGISGDGNTIVGQAYYNTTGTTGTRVNPTVGTAAGATNLFPNTTSNGRLQCSNFNGTVVGGYQSSSATGFVYAANGTTFLPNTGQNLTTVIGGVSRNLPAPFDCDAAGTWFHTNGINALSTGTILWNRLTQENVVLPNPFGTLFRATATGLTNYADVAIGFFVDGANLSNLSLNRGFLWTSSLGLVEFDNYVDSLYPSGQSARGTTALKRPIAISPDGEYVLGIFGLGPTASVTWVVRLGTPLRGDATLSDFVGSNASRQFQFEVRDSSNAVIDSWTQSLDHNDHFVRLSKIALGSGDYTLSVKGDHWLRKNIAFTNATRNSLHFTPINGDVDGNNEVGPGDFAILSSVFGLESTDSGFVQNADLDGNLEIGPSDFAILSNNFGLSGD